MAIRRCPQWLEKGKFYVHLQKGKVVQPHISPWEDYGANSSKSHFWEQLDQIYQEQFISNQP